MQMYRRLARPLLFRLPPETAQRAADLALGRRWIWRLLAPGLRTSDRRLQVSWCGLRLENPVGLAAGFDKDCRRLPSLSALGFGYLTGGTVTETPRPGNPQPRLARMVEHESLVNAMGFPNAGLEAAAARLEAAREGVRGTPVVVSVSGVTPDEIVRCHRRLEPLADAVEVNVSSPNTEGLRVFHEPRNLAELLDRVNEARTKPLAVKMPPYSGSGVSDAGEDERVMELAGVCLAAGVEGLTVANTRPVADSRLSTGKGGLSGRAIFNDMLRLVADVRSEVGNGVAINACGGIFRGRDAWEALRAGADTVQIFTALVYRGPGVVRQINRELAGIIEREVAGSVAAVTTRA